MQRLINYTLVSSIRRKFSFFNLVTTVKLGNSLNFGDELELFRSLLASTEKDEFDAGNGGIVSVEIEGVEVVDGQREGLAQMKTEEESGDDRLN